MKINARKSDSEATLLLYGDLGDYGDGAISAADVANALSALGSISELTVGINSNGGDVFAGLAIYNMLDRFSAHVTTRVDGLAASAASVVLMAGDEIHAAENSIVMIHNAWTIAVGNADDMRQSARVLDKVDDQLIDIYSRRSGLSKAKVKQMMAAETWLDASDAKDLHLVHTIIAASRVKASIDAKRFKNVPRWATSRFAELKKKNDDVRRRLGVDRVDAIRRRNEEIMQRIAAKS